MILESISLLTQVEYLMSLMMGMILEHMRIIQCRKQLEQQMIMSFCKVTKFGTLFKQLELLIQQYHGIFYNGCNGITFKGVPRLTLDLSGVIYNVNGSFTKWQRRSPDADRFAAARNRLKDLDAESSGTSSNSFYIPIDALGITSEIM